nr:hypothetical protein [Streptomyces sp. SID8379]
MLLAVIVVLLLRRRVQARSRTDTAFTMLLVLVLGILIAPTAFGQGVYDMVAQLASGVSQAGP